MSVVAFDTHKIVKRLRDAGFSEPQAEAVTAAVQEGAVIDLSHLATKADLQTALKDMATKADIKDMATKADLAEIRTELAEAKTDILKSMFSIVFGAVIVNVLTIAGAMFGLVKLLGR